MKKDVQKGSKEGMENNPIEKDLKRIERVYRDTVIEKRAFQERSRNWRFLPFAVTILVGDVDRSCGDGI